MSIQDDLAELQKKATTYDNLKEEYDRMIQGLDKIKRDIEALTPKTIRMGGTSNRGIGRAFVNEIYQRLQFEDGLQVDQKFIESQLAAKGLTINKYYVMTKLQQCKGVEAAKDGKKTRLFYHGPKHKQEDKLDIKLGKTNYMG